MTIILQISKKAIAIFLICTLSSCSIARSTSDKQNDDCIKTKSLEQMNPESPITLDCFSSALLETALAIAKEVDDPNRKHGYFIDLAKAYYHFQEQEKALEVIQLALNHTDNISETSIKAYNFKDIAEFYTEVDLVDKVIPILDRALTFGKQIKDPEERDIFLAELGADYGSIGLDKKA